MKMKSHKYVLLMFSIVFSTLLFADASIVLKEDNESSALGLHLEFLEDISGNLTIADVRSSQYKEKWFPSSWEVPNFGFTNSVYWAHVRITNSTSKTQDRLLEYANPMINSIELYETTNGIEFNHKQTGQEFPFSQRDVNYSNFVFSFSFAPGETKDIYLRTKTKLFVLFPLTLWSHDAFWYKVKNERMAIGFFLGIMFVMMFYNLFIFISVRDRSYLYYVAYIAFLIGHFISYLGIGYEYLWQNYPWWAQRSSGVFIGLGLISMLFFAESFLQTKKYTPNIYKFMQVLKVGMVIGILIALTFIQDKGFFAILLFSSCFCMIYNAVVALRQGYRPAKYFLWAWSLLLCSVFFTGFQILGILPYSFWTENAAYFGIVIQVILFSLALGDSIKVAQEEKLAMMNTFEKFVPKQFLNRIALEGFKNIELGKAKTEWITILFSDIRSFTDLSETMTPQELMNFLNEYLTRMNRPIHDSYGFIDKFIGDAIMGLFDRPNHSATDGVLAAIKMLEVVQHYNKSRIEKGSLPINMGIGIHTGEVIIGTVGSEDRMDSTVLGDTVNLASRLEGLTKYYNAQIVISSKTKEMLTDSSILYRPLDLVAVKGKKQAERIFEIFNSDPKDIQDKKQQMMADYNQALEFYYATKWDESLQLFEKCLKVYPEDIVCQTYVERCKDFKITAPSQNWDGVFRMTKK